MKILSISDKIVDFIYSPGLRTRFSDVDLVISCGDLPYYYVEFITSSLDRPVYFVRGNHASRVEYARAGDRIAPRGAIDLHKRMIRTDELLIAGIEGSVRYNQGEFQYTQAEMWSLVFRLVPAMLYNRAACGRFLDVFVTHAPPRGIHDKTDRAHIGANAFHWLLRTFRPQVHVHGHIHRYHPDDPVMTRFEDTRVINAYAYRVFHVPEIEGPA